MNNRVYPKNIFTREVNRINIAKLHCPKCFSMNVRADLNDDCNCKDCYSKFEFRRLLTHNQVRDKKIDSLLS
jgi:hypothetical protein